MKTYFIVLIGGLISAIIAGLVVIPLLKKLKFGQNILGYVKEHDYKSGTPTMGGIIFMISTAAVFFAFSSGKRSLAFVSIAVGFAYMTVGALDDLIKIKLKRNEGLNPIQKTLFELAIALIIAFYAQRQGLTKAYIPFFGGTVELKYWHFPICVFIFIATTNSVNLTDGLDGLAGGVSYVYFAFLAAIIYIQTSKNASLYVNASEYRNLVLLLCSLIGGILGFLCFNTFSV